VAALSLAETIFIRHETDLLKHVSMRSCSLLLTSLLASFLASSDSSPDCDEYARLGYCEQPKYKDYMKRHCSGSCEAAPSSQDEDEACATWAAEGYCTNPTYEAYMKVSCPNSCGIPPSEKVTDAAVEQQAGGDLPSMGDGSYGMGDEVEEEEEEEEEEEVAAAVADTGATAGASTRAAGAPEPENCVAWARQGLCEGKHEQYMKENCASACVSHGAGGADAGSSPADPITCARWAMMGLCDEGSAHVAYMKLNCADACEKAASIDLNAGIPPPVDLWLVVVVAAFGYVVFYVVRRSIASDAKDNHTIKRKMLGVGHSVGPGKQNRSALHLQKRSAKKA
jgi:hypothetical protein